MAKLLDNKVAVITGAVSGIGEATAELFAREGASLVLADINDEGAEKLIGRLQPITSSVCYRHTDVSDEQQLNALMKFAVDEFGRLDCLFNNAGISAPFNQLVDVPSADWRRVIDINLSGVFYGMQAALRLMHQQSPQDGCRGVIVNTSSSAGLRGVANIAPYVAAKHGVLGLTKTAALENAHLGIRVNAVVPGLIDTPMARNNLGEMFEVAEQTVPGSRAGRPKEVAEAVAWLCSDRASYVNGEALQIDMAALAGQ